MTPYDRNDHVDAIPDWKLERFLLDDLDEPDAAAIRGRLGADDTLRARLDALRESNRRILDEYPVAMMTARIRERARRAGGRRSVSSARWRRALPAAVAPAGLAAAVALTVFVATHRDVPPGAEGDDTRIKGASTRLFLHRKTADGSELLPDGGQAREHDLILLEYRTERPGWGVILSIDGRGAITRHLPETGMESVRLAAGQGHLMDHAYELDDAPGWEIFYLVVAEERFPVDAVEAAIRQAIGTAAPDDGAGAIARPADLALGDRFDVTTFTLLKEAGHAD